MSRSRFRVSSALSAVVLAAFGGALVFAGARVALGAVGSATLEDRLAAVLDLSDDPIPDFEPVLVERKRWASVPGARAEARQDIVMVTALVDEIPDTPFEDRLEGALLDLFRIEPAAPGYWAVLADLRADRGEVFEEVASAFRMSAVVERFEAPAMEQRVEFGLRTWDILGKSEREIVIADLLVMRSHLTEEQIGGLAELTAEMSDLARSEVRAAIEGRLGKDPWIDRLGV